MSKRAFTQHGSVHMVVIAVLVVALSASLGILFYQNFITKPTATAPSDTASQQKTDTLESIPIAYDSTIYEFDYPQSWTAAKDEIKNGSTPENILTITSPDQSVEVRVKLSHAVQNETCNTADNLKVRYYNVHQKPITELTAEKQFVVEAVTDAEGGSYNYSIGLAPDGGETHATLGDSRCTVKDVGLAAAYLPNTGSAVPTIYANIVFPKITDDKAKVKSIDDVTQMIASDNYKAALAILESGRQK